MRTVHDIKRRLVKGQRLLCVYHAQQPLCEGLTFKVVRSTADEAVLRHRRAGEGWQVSVVHHLTLGFRPSRLIEIVDDDTVKFASPLDPVKMYVKLRFVSGE